MEYAMPKLKLDPPPVVYENRMASSVENGGRGQVIDNGWNASVEERDSDYHGNLKYCSAYSTLSSSVSLLSVKKTFELSRG